MTSISKKAPLFLALFIAPVMTAMSVTTAAPASAQGLGDIVRNVIGGNNNNNGYNNNGFNNNGFNNGGFNQSSNARNYKNLNAAQLTAINNLDNNRNQANATITTAVSNGTLSMDQASMFQNQLSVNANEQFTYLNSGNFNFQQMQSVTNNLNAINTSITNAVASGAANPGANIGNNNWFNRNGGYSWKGRGHMSATYWPQFDSALNSVSFRLQEGLNNRTLDGREYGQLKSEYDQIVARQIQLKSGGMRVRNSDLSQLENRLSDLNNSITRQISDRNGGRGRRNWR